ncbi:Na+/H+ antiporter subunit D [Notoacmeibacter sp. MSK16QG-6]|uniref:Na+/H+ antiporter subunit D n=1 Tax=Notoacmeibacter sp. MSK16QG-6 TaxID=2957982 RepID=UPI00209F0138|nr:Na+/H+ antiporter subunit D [Notoacmeibacter sp. MSK16QG-6]MCP1198155.1 Na+/H+ antiporter subunit D [Notoacmeibacter sp. MSK16QG-6]
MAAAGVTKIDRSLAMVTEALSAWDWLVIAPVALPFLGAAALLILRKRIAWHAPASIGVMLLMLAANIGLLIRVWNEGPIHMAMGSWLPPFGIVFAVDTLGAIFATITAFTGLVCAIFATAEVEATEYRYGYFTFYLLMLAGVTGAFLTGDIFNLYVWFEVLLISSFGLLALGSNPIQLDGTFKYAILNLVATTLFLISVGLIYGIAGTLNMADLAVKARSGELAAPVMSFGALLTFAFLMKAAAFPLNAWLPASYHVTRSTSAALFAALLTKVGVYALLRTLVLLFPELGQTFAPIFLIAANATMLIGALGLLASSDIRRMVGWAVISGIGVILVGLGIGEMAALSGAIAYAVHSMVVMAGLYLLAGAMGWLSGSDSLFKMGGLAVQSPGLLLCGLGIVLATSGLPPFSGLWPKAILVEAALSKNAYLTVVVILVNGLLTTIALGRLFAFGFWREAQLERTEIGATPVLSMSRMAPIAIIVMVSLAFGLYPEPWLAASRQAAAGLLDGAAYINTVLPEG